MKKKESRVVYQTLIFELSRLEDLLRVDLSLRSGIIDIQWVKNERKLMNLHLENVTDIDIEKTKGKEILTINFSLDEYSPLYIELKPLIYVSWSIPHA